MTELFPQLAGRFRRACLAIADEAKSSEDALCCGRKSAVWHFSDIGRCPIRANGLSRHVHRSLTALDGRQEVLKLVRRIGHFRDMREVDLPGAFFCSQFSGDVTEPDGG